MPPPPQAVSPAAIQEAVKLEEQIIGRPLEEFEIKEVARNLEFQKLHQGHESQHAQMMLIVFAALISSQVIILLWKKHHATSYNFVTLAGLWLVPLFIAINSGNTRFVVIWSIFSVLNGYIIKRALESPMRSFTPRLVYTWFARLYDISYLVGAAGYFIALFVLLNIASLFNFTIKQQSDLFAAGVLIMFYACYFGTLGRDCVDRLSDRMALSIGYYSKTGFPKKHLRESMCAICGLNTKDSNQDIRKLACGHAYHFACIKGWTIIGKKDCCPYCKEKVDLNSFKSNPWDISQHMFLNLLDMVRYLLVWNPILFFILHFVFEWLKLK